MAGVAVASAVAASAAVVVAWAVAELAVASSLPVAVLPVVAAFLLAFAPLLLHSPSGASCLGCAWSLSQSLAIAITSASRVCMGMLACCKKLYRNAATCSGLMVPVVSRLHRH